MSESDSKPAPGAPDEVLARTSRLRGHAFSRAHLGWRLGARPQHRRGRVSGPSFRRSWPSAFIVHGCFCGRHQAFPPAGLLIPGRRPIVTRGRTARNRTGRHQRLPRSMFRSKWTRGGKGRERRDHGVAWRNSLTERRNAHERPRIPRPSPTPLDGMRRSLFPKRKCSKMPKGGTAPY